jgi:spore maturation protein CgeB
VELKASMNICVVGQFYAEGFALHIAETLTDMGHFVVRHEAGLKVRRRNGVFQRANQARNLLYGISDKVPAIRAIRMRKLWQQVESRPLDVVLVCHDWLLPEEVSELRRRSRAQVAMWFPDHIANLGPGYFLNAPYDAVFVKDPFIVQALESAMRCPIFYLPECFNPGRHRLVDAGLPKNGYDCDITTAGNMHSWRALVFSHLAEFDVRVWGPRAPLWLPLGAVEQMCQGRSVYDAEKAAAFLSAKIVLNTLHYGEVWGVNVRAFEAAGIGAFQMIDWRPGLAQLFREDHELIAYRGIEDLKAKIRYWLPRDAERRTIAVAGYRRAHSEHTYRHRLDLLLSSLCGRERGYAMPVL